MKVTVNTYLNVRVGEPSLGAPCYQYLAPGSEIEVDGELYPGEIYEGSSYWLKDKAGNYYWAGGVAEFDQNRINRLTFWNRSLGIKKIHKKYNEKGLRSNILIIDTGYSTMDGIKVNIIEERDFSGSAKQNVVDNVGHGTHCATIIGSKKAIHSIGIAPESKLLISKITDVDVLESEQTLKEALAYSYTENIDIISISMGIIHFMVEDKEALQKLINQQVLEKDRVVVAAVGNFKHGEMMKTDEMYPGSLENCIAVGACTNGNQLWDKTLLPDNATIFCYGVKVGAYTRNKQENRAHLLSDKSGTSQATAIVSGICALIISYLKKNGISYKPEAIKKLLTIYSSPLKGHEHYRLINPKLIFKKLFEFKDYDELQNLSECIDKDRHGNRPNDELSV